MAFDGFDLVEFVMVIEESLGVNIPDADAGRIYTMGDLYRYLHMRLRPYQSAACMSSAVFYQIRRALCESCGAEWRSVAPGARLDALMPTALRREHWRRLASAVPLASFPSLRRPAWVVHTMSLTTLVFLVSRVVCWYSGLPAAFLVLLTALSIFVGLLVSRATLPLAVRLPARCTAVGDLVRELLAANFRPRVEAVRRIDPCDLWDALRLIVADYARVSPDALAENTRFDRLGAA